MNLWYITFIRHDDDFIGQAVVAATSGKRAREVLTEAEQLDAINTVQQIGVANANVGSERVILSNRE